MTRQEAIEWFERTSCSVYSTDEEKDACIMAISALREQEEIQRHLKHFDIKEPRPEPVTKCRDLYDEDGGEILNRTESDTVKNDPLTLDELRKMDGEPIYVVDTVTGEDSQWCIVYVSEHFPGEGAALIAGCECYSFDFKDYGKDWTAYRWKPKEEP